MKQCKEMVNFEERTITCFGQEANLPSFVKSSFTPIFQKSFDTASSISPSLAGCDHENNGVSFFIMVLTCLHKSYSKLYNFNFFRR